MSSLITKEHLFNEVLVKPSKEYDTLCVVSGFATPSMVAYHLEAIKNAYKNESLNIKLIVGMTPNGIPKPHHKNFVKLTNEQNKKFECSYVNSESFPIHSKVYTWLKDGTPQKAFLSSANYTITGFKRPQDEVACECSPTSAYEYFNSKIGNSIYCTCDESSELIIDTTKIYTQKNKKKKEKIEKSNVTDRDYVYLPLFSVKENRIHDAGGLNWGQRSKREPNQAYIPVPSEIGSSGFFPPKGQPFSVLTDDGFPFICVVAQDNNKAIETTNNNSELGEYFRNKLGVPLGEPVKLEDLDRYGNRYVKFTKIDEEEYYMEYSPSIV